MSVHYKFKSTLDFDTITFDGLHISVGDLKRSIVHQKHLGKLSDFDLHITNAQTKEEYTEDNSLIPKNTSLVIARVPLSHQSKKSWDNIEKNIESRNPQKVDKTGLDISKMKGSEEEKIQAMMLQSTAEYDPKSYQKIRSQPQTGEVPPSYRCNKCKKGGHWIKNCPFNLTKEISDVKRNTGIPKSFQYRDEKQMESEKQEPSLPLLENQQEIPEDLICSMCHDLFTDAVMIPCCGSSFCDDCVRTALLESEDNECPDCKEKGSSPASLIPNRFLRNSVNAFKNATGYKINEIKKAARTETKNCSDHSDKTISEANEENVHAHAELKLDVSHKENNVMGTTDETVRDSIAEEKLADSDKMEKQADVQIQDELESDFEDNITIKMPPTQNASLREKAYNVRNMRHPKPPGIENSPQRQFQEYNDKKRSPTRAQARLEWDRDFRETCAEQNTFEVPSHIGHSSSEQYSRDIQELPHRPSNPHEVFTGPVPRLNMGYQRMSAAHLQINPATTMQTHHLLPFNNAYNQMDPRTNMSFPNFVRQPFPNIRPGCVPMRAPPNDVRQGITPNSNLASVYQGVAAKVGTGIIDDPLEAFNRIMKEKEKRKEDRRRTPDQRRSRSSDRHTRNRYRISPMNRRIPREQINREKHEQFRDKRDRRERDHDNSNRERIFRHKRSASFSDRSSRSRSWSVSPHRRRSRSPINYRRSRSRPSNYTDKGRSHGRARGQHIIRHALTEEKGLKKDIRSSSPVKRGEGFISCEGSKKQIFDLRSDSFEPPPPGFEAGPTLSYQWPQNDKHLYNPNIDNLDNNVKNERKNFDVWNKRSRSKSASNSNEKKTSKNICKSPTKKPFDDKRNENLLSSKDVVEAQQQITRETKQFRIVKHEKEHKYAATRDKLISQSFKYTAKKGEKELKHDIATIQSEKQEDMPSPKINYAYYDRKIEKQNKDILKVEKRVKERKKKSKKEKVDKKKLKKDKKEKRDRCKHTSATNDKSIFQETDAQISSEELKIIDQSSSNTKPSLEKTENSSNKQKSEKLGGHGFEDHGNFRNEIEEIRLIRSDQEISSSYGDIGDQLKSQLSLQDKSGKTKESSTAKQNTPPATFTRFDSVLDIHEYDTDFDANKPHQNQNDTTHITIPILSKWELDEQNLTPQISRPFNEKTASFQITDSGNDDAVTNEVLRKAEHAIFARAINAIRPIEGKKHSSELVHRSSIEDSPPSDLNKRKENSKEGKMKDFQITIPIGNRHERSVEIKPEKIKNLSHSPKRSKPSIKDRLGSKIVHKDHSSSHTNADFFKQERSDREHSNDCDIGSNLQHHSNPLRDRGRERERGQSKNRSHGGSAMKKSDVSLSNLRKRSHDGKKEEIFNFNREHDRYNERDTRRKLDERLQCRSTSDHYYSNRNKHIDVNVNFASNTKYLKRHTNEQNITRISRTDRGNCNEKIMLEKYYSDPKVVNLEQVRVTVNPFRKKMDLNLNSNFESEKRNLYIGNKESFSSSASETEPELNDSKRKKKHKDRKERKRVKRSTSAESAGSPPKKHKKKKNKSSKKKKKNKKHQEINI